MRVVGSSALALLASSVVAYACSSTNEALQDSVAGAGGSTASAGGENPSNTTGAGTGGATTATTVEAWNPFDPVTTTQCTPGAVDPGTAYQWLSKGTGALRFPICDPNGYNVVFQDIAAGVEEGTQVSCELQVPEPPVGEMLDLDTLTVVYTPNGNGMPIELTRVDNVSQCGPANFYIENDVIHICPQTCTTIEADNAAKLDIKIPCSMELN